MSLLDKILGRNKTLSQLDQHELRKEEILIGKQRDRLIQKLDTFAAQKKKLFEQGAKTTSPELRKAFAQQFELAASEQLMVAREINIRTKELMTVSRVRMVREHQGKGRALGRLNVTAADIAKLSGLIENDAVTQDMYGQQLDSLLELGAQSDRDALNGATMGESGGELLKIWEQMDRGELQSDAGLSAADDSIRRRSSEKN
jgi:hypothetical protein